MELLAGGSQRVGSNDLASSRTDGALDLLVDACTVGY